MKTFLRKSTSRNFYIFPIFLLITVGLLIAVNIYHFRIKYWSQQKQLLPCHDTSDKLKEININDII